MFGPCNDVQVHRIYDDDESLSSDENVKIKWQHIQKSSSSIVSKEDLNRANLEEFSMNKSSELAQGTYYNNQIGSEKKRSKSRRKSSVRYSIGCRGMCRNNHS